MSRMVWKYELAVCSRQIVEIPRDADILHVDNQRGKLCVWALVDESAQPAVRTIMAVHGTGHPLPTQCNARTHIGTVLVDEFVWHVFNLGKA